MNKTSLIIIVVLVIAGGIWYYMSRQEASAPTSQTSATQSTGGDTAIPVPTVVYTKEGFSPATINIKAGQSVMFANRGDGRMWVASGPHPNHEGYDGTLREAHCKDVPVTSFDQCSAGNNYVFTFTKKGTWKYHNHVLSSDFGTVIVE